MTLNLLWLLRTGFHNSDPHKWQISKDAYLPQINLHWTNFVLNTPLQQVYPLPFSLDIQICDKYPSLLSLRPFQNE